MLFWKKTRIIFGVLCAVLYWTSCGDVYRPIATPIINPGGDPQRTAFVYSLYSNPASNGTGVLSKIDVSGDSNMANMRVGRVPVAAAYLGGFSTSSIYVVNTDGTVTYQTPSTFQLPTTLDLYTNPGAPGFVEPVPAWVLSNQTNRVYVVNRSGPGPDCAAGFGSVSILSNISLLSTLCVGSEPVFGVQVPGGGRVYVLNSGSDTVSVIDPTLVRVEKTIAVGDRPVWAAFNTDASRLYVLNQGDGFTSGNVMAIDTTTNETVGAPPISIPVQVRPVSIVFERNRNRMYVPNRGSNSVSVIDLSHATGENPGALLRHIPTSTIAGHGLEPTSVAPLPDGTRVYVANSGSSDVSVIDTVSNSLIAGVGQHCTPESGNQVVCQPIDTIPTLRDVGSPDAPYTRPVTLFAEAIADLWIETEGTSTKVYVTQPNTVPQTRTDTAENAPDPDPIQSGTTIIRTVDNAISNYLVAPQQDLACQPNLPGSNPHIVCPLQTPVMILSQPH